MPMNWTADADAKLLSTIFQVCDVKVSTAQLKEIAESMGPDCTPKAVTHRIAKFRNAKPSGGDGGDGKGEGSANENGTATPKAKGAKGKKAAGEPKAKGKKGKGADERTPSPVSGDEGAGGMVTPPDTTTKKGSKRKSASADVDKESKKIKVEEGEEIAEGETEVEEGEITA